MAETLDTSQLLANEYEPKRQFQWIVEIDGLDAFVAKTFARPDLQASDIQIDYINEKRFLSGKDEWQPLDLTLYDPIEPSAAQKVMDWVRLRHDHATGRMGYASFYKRNFSLKMLDPVGNVVEKWNIIGAWIKNSNFGDLDYNSDDAVNVTINIRMDRASLEF